jgi:hypothetical protein
MTNRAAILVAVSAMASFACGGGKNDDTPFEEEACDQTCLDGAVIFATGLVIDDGLYNEQVVGQPLPRGGVACPGGGTVDISGSAVNLGGTMSLDLTYVLNGCRFEGGGYDLTYTGTVTHQGQFNNDTKVTNLTYRSESLTWSGTVGYGSSPYPTSGDGCALLMSRTPDLSGSLCGRKQTPSQLPPL